jgi:hypothetical protein
LKKLNDQKKHIPGNAFTACTAGISLLKTMTDAAEFVAQIATILLSTARSSFDEFQNARKCGQKLYILMKSISWGETRVTPNITGGKTTESSWKMMNAGKINFFVSCFFEGKARGESLNHSNLITERTRPAPKQ